MFSGARQLDAITGIRLGRGDRPVRSSTGLTASREVPPLRQLLPKVAQVRIHLVDGWNGACAQRSPEGASLLLGVRQLYAFTNVRFEVGAIGQSGF